MPAIQWISPSAGSFKHERGDADSPAATHTFLSAGGKRQI